MQATSALNQHLPFALEWVLDPPHHSADWKLLCCLYLDFLEFKRDLGPQNEAIAQQLRTTLT